VQSWHSLIRRRSLKFQVRTLPEGRPVKRSQKGCDRRSNPCASVLPVSWASDPMALWCGDAPPGECECFGGRVAIDGQIHARRIRWRCGAAIRHRATPIVSAGTMYPRTVFIGGRDLSADGMRKLGASPVVHDSSCGIGDRTCRSAAVRQGAGRAAVKQAVGRAAGQTIAEGLRSTAKLMRRRFCQFHAPSEAMGSWRA
jgi:hypothetical protein